MSKVNYILIIDDDRINNFVCSKILRISGFIPKDGRIECVLEAREAIEMLETNAMNPQELPDLIFLDINMPGMNGWEFLEKYKKIRSSLQKEIIVMMLSSSLYREDIDRSNAYTEVSAYLIKPLTIDRLKEVKQQFFS